MLATPGQMALIPDGDIVKWAYCTNGFADHRLPEALAVLADLGHTGAAITLDHGHLDPHSPGLAAEVSRIAGLLERLASMPWSRRAGVTPSIPCANTIRPHQRRRRAQWSS